MKNVYIKPEVEVIDLTLVDNIMDNTLIPSIGVGEGEGEEY